jgi:hypothetical protein
MRILLDECVNPRLRLAFPGYDVRTTAEMQWRLLSNGRLMEAAAPHFAEIRDVVRQTKPGQIHTVQIP